MNYLRENKKLIALLITAVMAFTLFAACGQNDTSNSNADSFINKEYSDSDMLTVNGIAFDYENGKLHSGAGIGFAFTDVINELNTQERIIQINDDFGLKMLYSAEDDPENIIPLYGFSLIPNDDSYGAEAFEMLERLYSTVEIVATTEDSTCYFAYNDDYSEFELSDKDKANLDTLFEQNDSLKDSICIFPVVKKVFSEDINMNDFNAKTLTGDVFTQDNFADYDLTMVNIWTTWCGPCVDEMPDLQKLYESLPDNVNMITICADANEETELANHIINDLGCTFQVLIPDDKLFDSLLSEVSAYPTTIFVDRNGNLVGEPKEGVPGKNPAEAYMQMIEEQLGSLGPVFGVAGE